MLKYMLSGRISMLVVKTKLLLSLFFFNFSRKSTSDFASFPADFWPLSTSQSMNQSQPAAQRCAVMHSLIFDCFLSAGSESILGQVERTC
jgi:hypothetical protein